jgi:Cu(I)/Ag(I) efflux system membrane fusion protein
VISLANLDQVWLLAEVFERQATWVKTGQIAEARLPSSPERVWTGVVEFIYPDLDPVTRTLRVRMRFENPQRLLMPNMYAHVEISGEPKRDILSIPREAIIYGSKETRVIVALGDGRFEAREIIVGIESDSSTEVVRGLNEGEMVVTSAQFLIDSEASLKASIHRLDPLIDQDNVKLNDEEGE